MQAGIFNINNFVGCLLFFFFFSENGTVVFISLIPWVLFFGKRVEDIWKKKNGWRISGKNLSFAAVETSVTE